MGVNQTDYIIWGVLVQSPDNAEYDGDVFYEKCDPYHAGFYDKKLVSKNNVSIVTASDTGLLAVGHILDRTYGHGGNFSTNTVMIPPPLSIADPQMAGMNDLIRDYTLWRNGIEQCLRDIGLYPTNGQLDIRWMVIQSFT